MSGKFEIGVKILFHEQELEIIGKRKGSKTKKINMHSGITQTGLKRKPCVWILSNGAQVKGETLLGWGATIIKTKQPDTGL